MSAPLVCPIRMVSLAVISSATIAAITKYPNSADRLADTVDKDRKNCNTHNCAMWDKRRKRCGLTTA